LQSALDRYTMHSIPVAVSKDIAECMTESESSWEGDDDTDTTMLQRIHILLTLSLRQSLTL